MRTILAVLVAVPLAAGAMPALGQSNPSTSQIIQSLKPSGNLLQGTTRGIRLVSPGASSATASAPSVGSTTPSKRVHAGTQPMAVSAAAPSVNLHVEFPTDSAELTPQARETLDQLGHALTSQDLASYRFRIEGHTDTVGSSALNQTLSQRRADAVAAYLEHTFAIPASRLETIGRGEEGLAVPTPPQTPEARNRRVEVINLGA